MPVEIYLIYADRDPHRQEYLNKISQLPIKPLRCCNNQMKNWLRHNSAGLSIDKLPIFICRRDRQTWLVDWSDFDEINRLLKQP